MPGFYQFDQHGQVRPIKDQAEDRATGAQRQIRRAAAEKVHDHHHALPRVHLIGGRADFGLFGLAVLLNRYGHNFQRGFGAHHTFHGSAVFIGQPPMGDNHDSDQAGLSLLLLALQLAVSN